MHELHKNTKKITDLVLLAAHKARKETGSEPEPELIKPIKWPVNCTVGPGLEGAIACESKIGYVNGTKGYLIYRGYDVFDLCANATFEEVAYLLLHGDLPTTSEYESFTKKLSEYRNVPNTIGTLMNFPIATMNAMSALRMGTNLMRHEFTYVDHKSYKPDISNIIGADEDSIPMETKPRGEKKAIYEFKKKKIERPKDINESLHLPVEFEGCYHLISGVASIAATVARLREGKFPISPKQELSHAANLIYMMTGKIPSPEKERIMDIALILHADHGMNASTFASMVVASTLSDIYFSVGSGIAALNGPLHGGANEQVIKMLKDIGSKEKVSSWCKKALRNKQKIAGFGHRVYKAYDPRARVLRPLASYLSKKDKDSGTLFGIAKRLEKEVVSTLGKEKKIFPNVDFYSGIVYHSFGIPPELFTPIFAVSRVSGWTARVMEYLIHNRIFRPRAMYTGPFNKKYIPIKKRPKAKQ